MKFEDLKFVRLTHPAMFEGIPRYLFEQVKDAEFKVDRLYQFGPVLITSPLTFLYILVNDTSAVKGILWAEVNPFNENIYANIFSVDKEYQNNGDAMVGAIRKLKEIQVSEKLTGKITSSTTRPKAVEKVGWKKSNQINMEI